MGVHIDHFRNAVLGASAAWLALVGCAADDTSSLTGATASTAMDASGTAADSATSAGPVGGPASGGSADGQDTGTPTSSTSGAEAGESGGADLPPPMGGLGASCETADQCDAAAGYVDCFEFGAAGMGCTHDCTDDAQCPGGYCANFKAAGFPIGQKCVRACETDAGCNETTTCVCDTTAEVRGTWCSVFAAEC